MDLKIDVIMTDPIYIVRRELERQVSDNDLFN